MKITPCRKRKSTYPTLAAVSAGAVIFACSACQQKQIVTGQFPAQRELNTPTHDKSGTERPPQTVIGRARVDTQTGEIVQPRKQKSEEPLLGGSVVPPKHPRNIQKQQPMGRYLIDDWQNDASPPQTKSATEAKNAGDTPPQKSS